MDRIDNGNGSFVMGMFRYSSFVGTANQIAETGTNKRDAARQAMQFHAAT
jgi:hypothetical protein